jgi:8-oxoguanine DNA glycosylase-like protein
MDSKLLRKHIAHYLSDLAEDPEGHKKDWDDRRARIKRYQSWTREKILGMDRDALYEYLAPLWAMLIWGNKNYVVDKLIDSHGLDKVRKELAELVWGKAQVAQRWDRFRAAIKGVGPAMMSEILCFVHPDECMIWNRRAFVSLDYLGVKNLPRYNYQLTGKRYVELSGVAAEIARELEVAGIKDVNLLTVDYFIWDELQVEDNLSQIFAKDKGAGQAAEPPEEITSDFIHDEVRDKLEEIGTWLGFKARTEIKVADGSKVDTIWEATIGNMGRVIYVFEVQTKGSIDSLLMNLLKALNNPAVQGVVAVSDVVQIEKIKKHSAAIHQLSSKLKCWDYQEVLRIHEALASVNESINRLGLVPQGF